MKVERTPNTFGYRFISCLCPSVWGVIINAISLIPLLNLFVLNPTTLGFWVVLLIAMPLPIYLLFIKPFIESKNFITRFQIDSEAQELRIDFLYKNNPKQDVIKLQDLRFNVIKAYKISPSDRLVLFRGDKKVVAQHANGGWSKKRIDEVAKELEVFGVKKPIGFNL